MDVTIDLSPFEQAGGNPAIFAWEFLRAGGWVYALALFLAGIVVLSGRMFLHRRQKRYLESLNYIMLALDIPKGNEQTPKAVESIFAHLHGIQRGGNWIDVLWKGYLQAPISVELVGLEGEIQFLVRVPAESRDLVEAAIYAQYPDAAITEVADYTNFVPDNFVEEGYDLWGTEMLLYNKQVYPIRTYPFFEHSLTQQFLDPLASLLEILSKLGPTEQVWIQLVLSPASDEWKEEGRDEVKRLLGDVPAPQPFLGGAPQAFYRDVYQMITASIIEPVPQEKPEKKEKIKYSELTGGQKTVVEAMEIKTAKLGWYTRFRVVYLAKKDYFMKSRGVAGVLGALKQYNTQDLNGFKPDKDTKTGADYWMVKRRVKALQDRILFHYKRRSFYRKFLPSRLSKWYSHTREPKPYILNVEELASIFHFPVMTVKAPQVQKTEARRAEPPTRLPVEPRGLPT